MKTTALLRSIALVAAIPALSVSAFAAEEAPASVEPLRANVTRVEDSRSDDGTGMCRVTISLVGDDIDERHSVLRTTVSKAIDDIGREVPMHPVASYESMGVARMSSMLGYRSGRLTTTLVLRNPSRKATFIKSIEGKVELYSATEDNGGIIRIKDGWTAQDTPLKDARFENLGIEITPLSEDKARELIRVRPGGLPELSPEEEQRRMDAVAAEVARRRELREMARGSADLLPPPAGPNPTPAASSRAETTATSKLPKYSFQIKDPQHRLVDIALANSSGKTLRTSSSYSTGSVRVLMASEPLPAGAQLVIYVASPDAVNERPFKIENVALP